MARHLRLRSIVASLAGFIACAALADHYNPDALNEAAREQMRAGDFATARILLRRAAHLAPHDARIAHSLRELEARRTGAPIPAAPPETAIPPPPAPAQARVPDEPPPPWPAR